MPKPLPDNSTMFPPHNSPHKGLRLKSPKSKIGSLSAAGNLQAPKTRSTTAGTVSVTKAATLPSRLATRKSLQSDLYFKPERDIATSTEVMIQQSTALSQVKSPNDRSKPNISKIATSIPAPSLKMQKPKRISIIPKRGKSSLFSPEPSPMKMPFEIFSDEDCDKSPTPRSRRVETPLGDVYLPKKCADDKHNVKMGGAVRSSLSLPNRRMKAENNGKPSRKTVRWNLATIPDKPPARLFPEESIAINNSQLENETQKPLFNPQGLDPGECLRSVKLWSKRDREIMENLLRALRELDYQSGVHSCEDEIKMPFPEELIPTRDLEGQVSETAASKLEDVIKILDPEVKITITTPRELVYEPEAAGLEDVFKMPTTEEQSALGLPRQSSYELESAGHDDVLKMPSPLEKFILEEPRVLAHKSEEARLEDQTTTTYPEEQITITTVKSLDPRVPEFQPLQRPKEMAWRPKRALPHPVASMKEKQCTDENAPLTLKTDGAPPRKNPGRKPTICDDHRAAGREVDSFERWYAERQLTEFTKKYPKTGNKAPPTKKLPTYKRSDIVAMSGPTAGRNAAAIQQRLEFLLWKNKEKKALEKFFPVGCV